MKTFGTAALGSVVFAALATAAPASAQTPNAAPAETGSALLDALVKCRAIASGEARLACYDVAASAMVSAERSGEVLVVDRQQARAARRQAFGFDLPSLNLFKGAREEEIDNVPLTLDRAWREGNKWVVRSAEGQVWRFTESTDLRRPPPRGAPMVIKKGAMGGYMMSLDGATGIRVRREQ